MSFVRALRPKMFSTLSSFSHLKNVPDMEPSIVHSTEKNVVVWFGNRLCKSWNRFNGEEEFELSLSDDGTTSTFKTPKGKYNVYGLHKIVDKHFEK